jgi:hypothetical protein
MRAALATLILGVVVASCGQSGDGGLNTAQLNRIAIQHNQVDDRGRTARLQPLGAFAAPADYQGPICRFTRGADILVFAFGNAAAARVDGALRTFRAQATIGPLGGFYRDNELALSIGIGAGEPARARVTNRVTEAQEDVRGDWTCEPRGG